MTENKNKDTRGLKAVFKKVNRYFELILTLAIVVLLVYFASGIGGEASRVDLTKDKRYTVSRFSRNFLQNLDDVFYVQLYLDGEMPYEYKRLQNAMVDMLESFRHYAGDLVQYDLINPNEGKTEKERQARYTDIMKKGLKPFNAFETDDEGGKSEKIIFPGAIVSHAGRGYPVNFLRDNPGRPDEVNVNHSIRMLEYELINAMKIIRDTTKKKIAFIEGHGELNEYEVEDITASFLPYVDVDRGVIGGQPGVLDPYEAIIIAKPHQKFSEQDKFVIDQYIMNGGKVVWMIDPVYVNQDSLATGSALAMPLDLNIDDQLFRYGARVNRNLVKDIQANVIMINMGLKGAAPKWTPAPWLYNPLLSARADHPLVKSLNMIKTEFVSEIDTLGGSPEVKKTVLLSTSRYSDLVELPAMIQLSEVSKQPDQKDFDNPNRAVMVLLEGSFTSVFKNRMYQELFPDQKVSYLEKSPPTKMFVISDGDIIKNEMYFNKNRKEWLPVPLGYDRKTNQTFGNKELMINMLNYLTGHEGLISLRSREIQLRLLDKAKIKDQKLRWQLINLLLPVLLVVVSGLVFYFARKALNER